MKTKLKDRLVKFLGEDADVPSETELQQGLPAAKKDEPKESNKTAQNFDNNVTSMSANIADLNRLTSDEDWQKYISKLDISAKTNLVEMNTTIGDLARKLNSIYADFTKSYWNATNKEDTKKNIKGKVLTQVDSDPSVTDDATNKLPPQGK